jgi:LPXTG-motif cell wall-anchored protein
VQAAQAAAPAQAGVAAGQANLPRTGTQTRVPLVVAGLMLLTGTPLWLVFRRRSGNHFAS